MQREGVLGKIALVLPFVFVGVACIAGQLGFCYEIPREDTRAEYLYVFGPQGNPYLGAHDDDHKQSVVFTIPGNASGDVLIEVYDPDTGGFRDMKPNPQGPWDTTVEFSVYGKGDAILAKQSFGESPAYDRKYYTFGPFRKEDGKKVGGSYQFTLVAEALEGTAQNLFKVRVFPDSAEAFSDKISFRLLPAEGDKMYFYARIPAGVSRIVAENYDLDPHGGTAVLEDPLAAQPYDIAESDSARWVSTPVDLVASQQPRTVVYVITKKTQHYANAAVRIKDEQGNILPLYYTMGPKAAAPRRISAPPAKTSPDLKCNKYVFDATSSYDPNKEKISYLWDFGDGTTSTEPVVTHLYEKGGEYTVTLTVKDTSGLECDSAISTQKVKVNTPPQANFSGPDSICANSDVTFDASATIDDTPASLTYLWDFGDGTKGEGRTVNKAYKAGGSYQVRLNVNDNAGTSCSTSSFTKTVTVNSAPSANAGDDIDLCFAVGQKLRVSFDGGRSSDPDGDALTYEWNFGDGQTATGATVSHVFDKPGSYTVGLTVNDGRGAVCSSDYDTLAVRLNRKPIANAGKDVVTCTGTAVVLDGSASQGERLSYSWNFGDGETGSKARVSHAYAKGGTYKAVLTVDDGKGTRCSVSSATVNVFVNGAPEVSVKNEASACVGEAVRFDAAASDPEGDALTYTWDFGDGTVLQGGASQSHAYSKGGLYSVQVTVDDKKGTPCSVANAMSNVKINSRPIANAGPNLVCCVDMKTVFDGSASSDPDGDSLRYRWSFGDGETADGAKVTHAYTKSGKYTVTLTVDDNSGTGCSTSSSSFDAVVNERPVSVIKVK